jgi:phosphatidylinositol alpha-1,6-mannosyltransferase
MSFAASSKDLLVTNRSTSKSTGILLVTELFPPAVGGSAELLGNAYSRVTTVPTTVLTDTSSGARVVGQGSSIRETSMKTKHWGLLHPGGASHHFSVARQIWRASRKGIGAVHCGRVLPEGLSALLAHGLGAPPYICWAHGEELGYVASSRELQWLASNVYSRARAVFANSRNTASLLTSAGVPADVIHVVRPGVDAERFRPDMPGSENLRRELAPRGQIICLTVGRLQRRKGHDLVIEALAALGPAAATLRYIVVGDGEERGRLESLVRAHGLQSTVLFKGAVAADDLPRYYSAADIFVHPNRVDGSDFEGFGIVFLEAAACGLPAIAGRNGGVAEAVVDGVTGLLVSGTEVSELQRSMTTLIDDRDLRRTMGRAGRARVEREFGWNRAAERISAVHAEVIAS